MSQSTFTPQNVAEKPRIDSLFNERKPLVSFEFFPPKDEASAAHLFEAIEELKPLNPDFVSITRTGGGTQPTLDLTHRVQNEIGIRSMAHLTCVHHTPEEMAEALDCLWERGIRNVVALRGDLPPGQAPPKSGDREFAFATDLVTFVRERHDFCIAVAGYPEGHPQCLNLTRDLEYLKQKIDNGGHFIITQLFFDNADFYRWRDAAQKIGIDAPFVAGIMPILGVAQIKRFVGMCGAKIPNALLQKLESLESDPMSVHAAGVEHAISQCEDLMRNGVDGLHFYTLNRSKATNLITQELPLSR